MNILKINDYVRTKYGEIAKIYKCLGKDAVYKNMQHYETDRMVTKFNNFILYEEDIIKSSPNIIDLIEKSDLVVDNYGNVYVVDYVFYNYIYTTTKQRNIVKTLCDYQIKSIVTKEQFESTQYEVEL